MFTSLAVPACVWKSDLDRSVREWWSARLQSYVGHSYRIALTSSGAQRDISSYRKHGTLKPNAIHKGRPHILIATSDSGGLLMSI